MRVYNSILAGIKPHVGAANIHYVDAFDSEFSLLLREEISKFSCYVKRCTIGQR